MRELLSSSLKMSCATHDAKAIIGLNIHLLLIGMAPQAQGILVIGAKGHKRAHCIDWLGHFPNIEEYDAVIINLQTLSQSLFDRLQDLDGGKLLNIQKEIRTIFETGREVFCIINEWLQRSPIPGTPIIAFSYPHNNYDWLFVFPHLEKKSGTSVRVVKERFSEYIKLVSEWHYEISLTTPLSIEPFQRSELENYKLIPIAVNRSNKIIAGSVVEPIIEPKYKDGRIHLLPPPTECDLTEAIEVLIDIASKEKRIHPHWRQKVEIPGLGDIGKEIEKRKRKIEGLEKEIEGYRRRWNKRERYRDLLEADSDALVDIVQKTLLDIGIRTKKTRKGFVIDLISKRVAVEVTGTAGKIDTSSEKFGQILRFLEKYHKREKVILIANTYKRLSTEQRKGKLNFTPEVVEVLESKDVCLMTTLALIKLWKIAVKKKGRRQDIMNKILNITGELVY